MGDALLETAARQFVESYGSMALAVLQQRAEDAKEHRHDVAAKVWREIADVVIDIGKLGATRAASQR